MRRFLSHTRAGCITAACLFSILAPLSSQAADSCPNTYGWFGGAYFDDSVPKPVDRAKLAAQCEAVPKHCGFAFSVMNSPGRMHAWERSICFQRLARFLRDESLCERVLPRDVLGFIGGGGDFSPEACRREVAEAKAADAKDYLPGEPPALNITGVAPDYANNQLWLRIDPPQSAGRYRISLWQRGQGRSNYAEAYWQEVELSGNEAEIAIAPFARLRELLPYCRASWRGPVHTPPSEEFLLMGEILKDESGRRPRPDMPRASKGNQFALPGFCAELKRLP